MVTKISKKGNKVACSSKECKIQKAMRLSKLIKLGIIGYPLGHSLSPVIQKAAMDHFGLEGNYDVLETPPEKLVDRLNFLKSRDIKVLT